MSLGGAGGTGELMCSQIRTNMHILPHSCEVRGPSSLLLDSADVGLGPEAPTTKVPHPPSPPQRGGNNTRTETITRLPAGCERLIVLPGPSNQETEQPAEEAGQSSAQSHTPVNKFSQFLYRHNLSRQAGPALLGLWCNEIHRT